MRPPWKGRFGSVLGEMCILTAAADHEYIVPPCKAARESLTLLKQILDSCQGDEESV